MGTRSAATILDLLMAIGLLPSTLWLAVVLLQIFTVGARGFDLTILMIAGVSGVVAYLIACIVSGGSAIWTLRRAKVAAAHVSQLTKTLSLITASVMVAPWIFFVLRQVGR